MDNSSEKKKHGFLWLSVIGIILGFGLLILGLVLYTPLRIRHYTKNLASDNEKEFLKAVNNLIAIGPKGEEALRNHFENNSAGWGKPVDGLIARAKPKKFEITVESSVDMKIDFLNISSKAKCIMWRGVFLIKVRGKPPFVSGGWGGLPGSRPRRTGRNRFYEREPLELEPGQLAELPLILKIRRKTRHMDSMASITPLPKYDSKIWFRGGSGINLGMDSKAECILRITPEDKSFEPLKTNIITIRVKSNFDK